jgi:hypothetical protein
MCADRKLIKRGYVRMSFYKQMSNVLELQTLSVNRNTPNLIFFSSNSVFVCCSNTVASTVSIALC